MTISIQGKDVKGKPVEIEAGFKWNNHCFEKFAGMRGKDTISGWTLGLIYCGYSGWCLVRNEDEKLTIEDFSDWMEQGVSNPEILEQVRSITDEANNSPIYKEFSRKAAVKKNELQKVETAA